MAKLSRSRRIWWLSCWQLKNLPSFLLTGQLKRVSSVCTYVLATRTYMYQLCVCDQRFEVPVENFGGGGESGIPEQPYRPAKPGKRCWLCSVTGRGGIPNPRCRKWILRARAVCIAFVDDRALRNHLPRMQWMPKLPTRSVSGSPGTSASGSISKNVQIAQIRKFHKDLFSPAMP